MYYTKNQMEELKNLNVIQHFNTVLNSEYKRGTYKETDNKLADIYEAATGKKVARNFNCKLCVYNLYRDAGKLYRETEKYYKYENLRKAREAKQLKQLNNNKEKENK